MTFKNKYLLFQRSKEKGGLWNSVAGSKKSKETTAQAIQREIKEETGLTICPTFLTTTHHEYDGQIVAYHIFVYSFSVDPTKALVLNEESQNFGWFTLAEALKRALFEDEDFCLKMHDKMFKK